MTQPAPLVHKRMPLMKRMGFHILCVFILVFCLSGCSSVLTYLGPVQHELADGETFTGDLVEYDYEVYGDNSRLHFMKTPMCKKIVEKVRVSKKQRRGLYLAVLELPFFGLGLLDMLRSYAIVEESRRVEPVGRFETGEQLACNGREPAANEIFIIKDNVKDLNVTAETDSKGNLDLKTVLPENFGPASFEIFPEADLQQQLTYTYLPAE